VRFCAHRRQASTKIRVVRVDRGNGVVEKGLDVGQFGPKARIGAQICKDGRLGDRSDPTVEDIKPLAQLGQVCRRHLQLPREFMEFHFGLRQGPLYVVRIGPSQPTDVSLPVQPQHLVDRV
jgi:hypothetical protein